MSRRRVAVGLPGVRQRTKEAPLDQAKDVFGNLEEKGKKIFLTVTIPDHEVLECRDIGLILFLASLLKKPLCKLVDTQ